MFLEKKGAIQIKNNLDRYLFHKGEHRRAYEYFGAHPNERGTFFRIWAPNAKRIQIIGTFNNWNGQKHYMVKVNNEGIWELEIEGVFKGELYKYKIEDIQGNFIEKSDPYGVYSEMRPNTASIVYGIPKFQWTDKKWMKKPLKSSGRNSPINIYEVHLGSWQRNDDGTFMNYKDIAHKLSEYLKYMNYTHIELMPLCEYPLDDSWGYQITGYFAVTSRHGTPEDFMYFCNHLHNEGIGIILDWVPGHFCKDSHGLYRFDGTPTYEHSDQRIGENPQWGTCNFDYSKGEVLSFLYSNALYWLREYHIDGLRIDAIANILYLNFGKEEGFSAKNIYGGDENIEGVNFLKGVNHIIREEFPEVMTFAEDSTTWGWVTKPAVEGGLGFSYKWNMGWMNDTLKYMEIDPMYRVHHSEKLTFSFMYAYNESYILPLSHDEVVHGKKSLLEKMPHSLLEEKILSLRLYMSYMMAHPGKKLNFMGNELGQGLEWRFYEPLEWHVLENYINKNYHDYIRALNRFYLENPPLWELDSEESGFRWGESIECDNILTFYRRGKKVRDEILFVFNFSNTKKEKYRVKVEKKGDYEEVFNSVSPNKINMDTLKSKKSENSDEKEYIEIELSPLTAIFLRKKVNIKKKD